MADAKITAERVRELVSYSAETGIFRWKASRPGCRAGDVTGSRTANGYIRLHLDGVKFLAHRIAWLYVHGSFPSQDVDHINGDRTDNSIANLRDVSRSHNMQNRASANRNSRTGMLGVRINKNSRRAPWSAVIKTAGKAIWLGSYASAEDAHAAYLSAKARLHEGSVLDCRQPAA